MPILLIATYRLLKKLVVFNNASNAGRFVMVNPTSIALIEQADNYTVRVTMKEIRDGQSISFTDNYDITTLLSMLNN